MWLLKCNSFIIAEKRLFFASFLLVFKNKKAPNLINKGLKLLVYDICLLGLGFAGKQEVHRTSQTLRVSRILADKQKTAESDCLLIFAPEFLLSQAKSKSLRTLRMRRMPKTY